MLPKSNGVYWVTEDATGEWLAPKGHRCYVLATDDTVYDLWKGDKIFVCVCGRNYRIELKYPYTVFPPTREDADRSNFQIVKLVRRKIKGV